LGNWLAGKFLIFIGGVHFQRDNPRGRILLRLNLKGEGRVLKKREPLRKREKSFRLRVQDRGIWGEGREGGQTLVLLNGGRGVSEGKEMGSSDLF